MAALLFAYRFAYRIFNWTLEKMMDKKIFKIFSSKIVFILTYESVAMYLPEHSQTDFFIFSSSCVTVHDIWN